MAKKECRCLYSYLKTHRDKLSKKKQLKQNALDSKLFKLDITNIKNILDNQNIPERIIKVEKKEKGLYERTQDSVILLTEDNKMMLTD